MGLMDAVRGVAIAVGEEAHGARLKRELEGALAAMQRMSKAQQADTAKLFGYETRDLFEKKREMTRDGRLKVAARLRANALKSLDFNIVDGYALLMASAWLESQERTSAEARAVFAFLEDFANETTKATCCDIHRPIVQLAMTAFIGLVVTALGRAIHKNEIDGEMRRYIQEADTDVLDALTAIALGFAKALEAASGDPKMDCWMASMMFLYTYGAPRKRIEALSDAVDDRSTETTLFSPQTMAVVYRTIQQADSLMRQRIAAGVDLDAMAPLLPLVELLRYSDREAP